MNALTIASGSTGLTGEHMPFYISAALLALWAVVIGVIGIRNGGFPSSSGATKAIGAITAVLVFSTVGFAIGTAETFDNPTPRPQNVLGVVPQPAGGEAAAAADSAPPAAAPKGGPIAQSSPSSGALAYDVKELAAKAGPITIVYTNKSPLPHNIVIEKSGGAIAGQTPTFSGGERTLKVNLPAGTYTFYCSVPGHRQAGMVGQLVVS